MNEQEFKDATVVVDGIAKKMNPTHNGPCGPDDFMREVEAVFKLNNWNLSSYIKTATDNHMARCAREK